MDFHKAFDSLEIPFLIRTLEQFNFGQTFISWVKTLYNKPQVLIKNNGWLSKPITTTRGIRQGCPLSAMLFIISVEILSLHIKQENSIPGITIRTIHGQKEIKIAQYADDANIFLKRIADVTKAIEIVNRFSNVAGPTLNIDKTEGMKMFADLNNNECFEGISWKTTPIRCLGVYVGLDKTACNKQNWLNKLDEMQKLLDNWRSRDLTLFGRVTIVKVLGLSKFTYLAQNTDIPDNIIAKISHMTHRFIWKGPDRVKRKTIIESTGKGGLNMIDLKSYFSSLKSVWIKRILDSSQDANWSCIAKQYLNGIGTNNYFLYMDFSYKNMPTYIRNLPEFYTQLLSSFNSSKPEPIELDEMTTEDILNMSIWGNRLIQYRRHRKDGWSTLFYKNWVKVGIRQIKDLAIINQKLSPTHISQKLRDKRNMHIEINILQKAIQPILQIIKNNNPEAVLQNLPPIPCIHPKNIYNQIAHKSVVSPTMQKWEAYFNVQLTLDNIHQLFNSRVTMFQDLKLAEFNFKTLHFIVATANIVNKWNKDISAMCEICKVKNDLPHLLLRCVLARKLWNDLGLCGKYFNNKSIILGSHDLNDNYLISFTCFTLYKFWLIKSKGNESRTYFGLKKLLKSDFKFKSCVLRKTNLKQNEKLAAMLENLVNDLCY